MARAIITMVGGGSCNWSPVLLKDILLKEELSNAEIRLFDINLDSAKTVAEVGRRYTRDWGLNATFKVTNNPDVAFDGADFVLITISTGGLDAMAHDLRIPEKYGIFQTVGDTVGRGWARGLRNIPVFLKLAEQIKRNAPNAMILNYTNPMSVLTKTLSLATTQPVVGLCHGVFENYRRLQTIFGLKGEEQLKVKFGGLNHFFWILDFSIDGKPGYPLLRRKLQNGRKTIDDLIRETYVDTAGHSSPRRLVASELLNTFGYLTYMGDRHTSEFFSHYLAPDRRKLSQYELIQTTIAMRKQNLRDARKRALDIIKSPAAIERKRSRETAADIMAARMTNRDFVDVVNLPNIGQIADLPHGAVVETLGVVNALGFMPVALGHMPPQIVNVIMPHVINMETIVKAGIEGDRWLADQALINDPLCAHLSMAQVRKMGDELLKANRKCLPQFFGKKAKK